MWQLGVMRNPNDNEGLANEPTYIWTDGKPEVQNRIYLTKNPVEIKRQTVYWTNGYNECGEQVALPSSYFTDLLPEFAENVRFFKTFDEWKSVCKDMKAVLAYREEPENA